MVEQVSELPPGYKAIGPVDRVGAGKAIALAEPLRAEKNALALLTQHFKQHAEKFPKDFNATGLVFRVVATVENTPQRGWGTLIVEFGYRPNHGAKKKPAATP
jgi:hypothetical protein